MKIGTCALLFWCLVALSSLPALAQDGDTSPRGAFIITRKNPVRTAPPPSKPAKSGAKSEPAGASRPEPATANSAEPVAMPYPIGVGYTVYKRDANGHAVRVSPSQVFYHGDAVRLVIEPNIDGYLYVFHTENDSSPQMIFPDSRLNGGENRIKAHVPYELPSSLGPLPWFEFDERPATERLYLVILRERLPNVKTGAELVTHCQPNPSDCLWRPSKVTWEQVAAGAQAPRRTDVDKVVKIPQPPEERVAIERGIKLGAKAVEPTVVNINTSAEARLLVVSVVLIHQARP